MDLRVLEYFLTVADEENISHAAELLHVSQPTISRQLMELEEELDRKLFVRTNKKVILTEEGVLFRETAEDILKLYNRARADHTGQSELEGEIYIACGEIESFDLVAGKIRDFHLNHPKVQFHIHSGNAEEICAAIDKGTADIGYIVQSVNTMKYEVFSLNTSEQWGILVNRNHRLAAKEYVTATYTLFRNAMILTELSDWVTICLETRKYTGDNLVFVPFSPLKTSSASLIWKKRAVYSPAMHEFLSCFGIRNLNDR